MTPSNQTAAVGGHTPTPWAIDGDDEGFDGIPYIEIAAGTCGMSSYKPIAQVQPTFYPGTDDFALEVQDRANAALIVRAVNSHEALVEALKRAEQFIANGVALGFIRMPDAGTPDPAHDTLPAIRAALQQAGAGDE